MTVLTLGAAWSLIALRAWKASASFLKASLRLCALRRGPPSSTGLLEDASTAAAASTAASRDAATTARALAAEQQQSPLLYVEVCCKATPISLLQLLHGFGCWWLKLQLPRAEAMTRLECSRALSSPLFVWRWASAMGMGGSVNEAWVRAARLQHISTYTGFCCFCSGTSGTSSSKQQGAAAAMHLEIHDLGGRC